MTTPHRHTTHARIAVVLVKNWRRWPDLARVLARYGRARGRFYVQCWAFGCTVREGRRLARLYRLTGGDL